MGVYFCADLHLKHNNIHKYRGYCNSQVHDEIIRQAWHNTIGKRDMVIVAGDVCFSPEAWQEFATWPGRKIVVLGNHCTEHSKVDDIPQEIEIHGMLKYKEFWVTHAPIHPKFLRGKLNIHGHLHDLLVPDTRYFNVGLEHTNMAPISLEAIREELKLRQNPIYTAQTLGVGAAARNAFRQLRGRK